MPRFGARPRRFVLLAAGALLCAPLASSGAAFAQQPSIFYVYDDLNRLIAVVDQQGNAATYTYDAVGNILAIERFDISAQPGPVRITLVSPSKGKVGTQVQIFGTGFSPTPSQNTVTFTGATASTTDAGPTRLVTTVPSGAATGTISVTAPLGSATSLVVFRVLGDLTVTPATASIVVTRSQQFQALEAGTATTNVRWAVNDLPSGDTTVGTVTADGVYTAPAIVPTPSTVKVTAIHKDDATLTASATVTVVPRQPVFVAARAVSVGVAEARTVNQSVTATLSVAVAQTATPLAAASPISVAVAETATSLAAAGSVSVQVAESSAALAAAPLTTVALEPVVTAVAPATGAAGASFTMTLTGRGFSGATGVSFLQNNALDGTVMATNIAVSPDGTELTANVSIATGAATGARVVQVTTPTAVSTAAGTGGNLFTVQ